MNTMPCAVCEEGTVRPTDLYGQRMPYRDEPSLRFDEHVTVMACDTCGERYLRADEPARIEHVLTRLYADQRRDIARAFEARVGEVAPGVALSTWEQAFGLSRGYISRLASGRKTADTRLEIILEGMIKAPHETLCMLDRTGRLPDEIRRAARPLIAPTTARQ
jgi:hypothetical protein